MTEEEDCRAQADMHAGCFHNNRVDEGGSWQHRAEWYEKKDKKITKTLLEIKKMVTKIKRMIELMDLESGWDGEEKQQSSV